MIIRVKHIFGALGILLLLTGCKATIHEYPQESSLTLNITCEVGSSEIDDMETFVTAECESANSLMFTNRVLSANNSGETIMGSPLRYTIDLYKVEASHAKFKKREQIVINAGEEFEPVSFRGVTAGKYKVLVWCEKYDADRSFYNIEDLKKVTYNNDIEIVDNNDKDAFTNSITVDLRDYTYKSGNHNIDKHIIVTRPHGRFKFISYDISEYNNHTDYITTLVNYSEYAPTGYNVEEQKANAHERNKIFSQCVNLSDSYNSIDGDRVLDLCYDFIFIGGSQTNIAIKLEFYDGKFKWDAAKGKLVDENGVEATDDDFVNSFTNVIPLKRDKLTPVIGRLLTQRVEGGGIVITPGFDDEFIVEIPED